MRFERGPTTRVHVLKADIKRSIGVRGEDSPLLAGNVSGPAVLVANRIPDLHVDLLAIALEAADSGRDNDESVLADKVTDAALLAV